MRGILKWSGFLQFHLPNKINRALTTVRSGFIHNICYVTIFMLIILKIIFKSFSSFTSGQFSHCLIMNCLFSIRQTIWQINSFQSGFTGKTLIFDLTFWCHTHTLLVAQPATITHFDLKSKNFERPILTRGYFSEIPVITL